MDTDLNRVLEGSRQYFTGIPSHNGYSGKGSNSNTWPENVTEMSGNQFTNYGYEEPSAKHNLPPIAAISSAVNYRATAARSAKNTDGYPATSLNQHGAYSTNLPTSQPLPSHSAYQNTSYAGAPTASVSRNYQLNNSSYSGGFTTQYPDHASNYQNYNKPRTTEASLPNYPVPASSKTSSASYSDSRYNAFQEHNIQKNLDTFKKSNQIASHIPSSGHPQQSQYLPQNQLSQLNPVSKSSQSRYPEAVSQGTNYAGMTDRTGWMAKNQFPVQSPYDKNKEGAAVQKDTKALPSIHSGYEMKSQAVDVKAAYQPGYNSYNNQQNSVQFNQAQNMNSTGAMNAYSYPSPQNNVPSQRPQRDQDGFKVPQPQQMSIDGNQKSFEYPMGSEYSAAHSKNFEKNKSMYSYDMQRRVDSVPNIPQYSSQEKSAPDFRRTAMKPSQSMDNLMGNHSGSQNHMGMKSPLDNRLSSISSENLSSRPIDIQRSFNPQYGQSTSQNTGFVENRFQQPFHNEHYSNQTKFQDYPAGKSNIPENRFTAQNKVPNQSQQSIPDFQTVQRYSLHSKSQPIDSLQRQPYQNSYPEKKQSSVLPPIGSVYPKNNVFESLSKQQSISQEVGSKQNVQTGSYQEQFMQQIPGTLSHQRHSVDFDSQSTLPPSRSSSISPHRTKLHSPQNLPNSRDASNPSPHSSSSSSPRSTVLTSPLGLSSQYKVPLSPKGGFTTLTRISPSPKGTFPPSPQSVISAKSPYSSVPSSPIHSMGYQGQYLKSQSPQTSGYPISPQHLPARVSPHNSVSSSPAHSSVPHSPFSSSVPASPHNVTSVTSPHYPVPSSPSQQLQPCSLPQYTMAQSAKPETPKVSHEALHKSNSQLPHSGIQSTNQSSLSSNTASSVPAIPTVNSDNKSESQDMCLKAVPSSSQQDSLVKDTEPPKSDSKSNDWSNPSFDLGDSVKPLNCENEIQMLLSLRRPDSVSPNAFQNQSADFKESMSKLASQNEPERLKTPDFSFKKDEELKSDTNFSDELKEEPAQISLAISCAGESKVGPKLNVEPTQRLIDKEEANIDSKGITTEANGPEEKERQDEKPLENCAKEISLLDGDIQLTQAKEQNSDIIKERAGLNLQSLEQNDLLTFGPNADNSVSARMNEDLSIDTVPNRDSANVNVAVKQTDISEDKENNISAEDGETSVYHLPKTIVDGNVLESSTSPLDHVKDHVEIHRAEKSEEIKENVSLNNIEKSVDSLLSENTCKVLKATNEEDIPPKNSDLLQLSHGNCGLPEKLPEMASAVSCNDIKTADITQNPNGSSVTLQLEENKVPEKQASLTVHETPFFRIEESVSELSKENAVKALNDVSQESGTKETDSEKGTPETKHEGNQTLVVANVPSVQVPDNCDLTHKKVDLEPALADGKERIPHSTIIEEIGKELAKEETKVVDGDKASSSSDIFEPSISSSTQSQAQSIPTHQRDSNQEYTRINSEVSTSSYSVSHSLPSLPKFTDPQTEISKGVRSQQMPSSTNQEPTNVVEIVPKAHGIFKPKMHLRNNNEINSAQDPVQKELSITIQPIKSTSQYYSPKDRLLNYEHILNMEAKSKERVKSESSADGLNSRQTSSDLLKIAHSDVRETPTSNTSRSTLPCPGSAPRPTYSYEHLLAGREHLSISASDRVDPKPASHEIMKKKESSTHLLQDKDALNFARTPNSVHLPQSSLSFQNKDFGLSQVQAAEKYKDIHLQQFYPVSQEKFHDYERLISKQTTSFRHQLPSSIEITKSVVKPELKPVKKQTRVSDKAMEPPHSRNILLDQQQEYMKWMQQQQNMNDATSKQALQKMHESQNIQRQKYEEEKLREKQWQQLNEHQRYLQTQEHQLYQAQLQQRRHPDFQHSSSQNSTSYPGKPPLKHRITDASMPSACSRPEVKSTNSQALHHHIDEKMRAQEYYRYQQLLGSSLGIDHQQSQPKKVNRQAEFLPSTKLSSHYQQVQQLVGHSDQNRQEYFKKMQQHEELQKQQRYHHKQQQEEQKKQQLAQQHHMQRHQQERLQDELRQQQELHAAQERNQEQIRIDYERQRSQPVKKRQYNPLPATPPQNPPVQAQAASSTPSTPRGALASPLDLSVKTVRQSADSTATDEHLHREMIPSVPKLDISPNFNNSQLLTSMFSGQQGSSVPSASALPLKKQKERSITQGVLHNPPESMRREPAVPMPPQPYRYHPEQKSAVLPRNNAPMHSANMGYRQTGAPPALSGFKRMGSDPILQSPVPSKFPKVDTWRETIDFQIDQKLAKAKQEFQEKQLGSSASNQSTNLDKSKVTSQQSPSQGPSQGAPHISIPDMSPSHRGIMSPQQPPGTSQMLPQHQQFSPRHPMHISPNSQHPSYNQAATRHPYMQNQQIYPPQTQPYHQQRPFMQQSLGPYATQHSPLQQAVSMDNRARTPMYPTPRPGLTQSMPVPNLPTQSSEASARQNLPPFNAITFDKTNFINRSQVDPHLTEGHKQTTYDHALQEVLPTDSNKSAEFDNGAARIRTKAELKQREPVSTSKPEIVTAQFDKPFIRSVTSAKPELPPPKVDKGMTQTTPMDTPLTKSKRDETRGMGIRSSSETSVFDFRDSDSEDDMPKATSKSLEAMRMFRKSKGAITPSRASTPSMDTTSSSSSSPYSSPMSSRPSSPLHIVDHVNVYEDDAEKPDDAVWDTMFDKFVNFLETKPKSMLFKRARKKPPPKKRTDVGYAYEPVPVDEAKPEPKKETVADKPGTSGVKRVPSYRELSIDSDDEPPIPKMTLKLRKPIPPAADSSSEEDLPAKRRTRLRPKMKKEMPLRVIESSESSDLDSSESEEVPVVATKQLRSRTVGRDKPQPKMNLRSREPVVKLTRLEDEEDNKAFYELKFEEKKTVPRRVDKTEETASKKRAHQEESPVDAKKPRKSEDKKDRTSNQSSEVKEEKPKVDCDVKEEKPKVEDVSQRTRNKKKKGGKGSEPQTPSITPEKQPGWEDALYAFKRSLRMPAALIKITRPPGWPKPRASSLPDIDSRPESPVTCDSLELNEDKSQASRVDKNDHKAQFLNQLAERYGAKPKGKGKKDKQDTDKCRIIPQVNEPVELPTPCLEDESALMEKPLKSRTRTELRKDVIRRVFGDDRPASAPPAGFPSTESQDTSKTSSSLAQDVSHIQKKKVDPSKLKKKMAPLLSRTGLRSATKLRSKKVLLQRISNKKQRASQSGGTSNVNKALNLGKDWQQNKLEQGMNPAGEASPSVLPKKHYKSSRRKFRSSGFDYLRKKKKKSHVKHHRHQQLEEELNRIRVSKSFGESIEDVATEIRSWVINKHHGETPLHRAARLGYIDAVAYCLEKFSYGPAPKDNAGYTPLHEACSHGWLEIARMLLMYGADASDSALGGIRPLHDASEKGCAEVVRLLLSYGADPLLASYAGHTPLSITSDDTTRLLLEHHLADVKGESAPNWEFKGPPSLCDLQSSGYDPFAKFDDKKLSGESEVEEITIEYADTTLPNLYIVHSEPDDRWVLFTEIISHFKPPRTKDGLLKQLNETDSSIFKDIKVQEFNEMVRCTSLCAKNPIKSNPKVQKITLVKYTEALKNHLKIQREVIPTNQTSTSGNTIKPI